LTSVLKEYKKWQDNRRDELGDYMQENDYVFIQENGARLYPSTFTGWLNKMLKDAGIEHYSLHSLRHTNITMQIAEGVPIVTVSARAGHARTSTTTDIYAYFLKSSDKSAAQTISNAFERENDISDDTLQQFKQVKAEMSRLGFSTISEYQEYLEFLNFKKNNNL
jgi:integrase